MEKALEQFRALNKERPYENIEILEKDGEPIAVESGDALSCFVKREGRYTFKVTIEPCEEIPDPNTAL